MTEIERIIKTAQLRQMKSDKKSDLADRIGVNRSTVVCNMRSPSGMPLGRLKAIVQATGMTPEEVYAAVMSVQPR